MAWLYCPPQALDAATGQCSDPHWVDQMPGGLPPLSASEGSEIAWAIVGAWALGYVGRLIRIAMKGRFT